MRGRCFAAAMLAAISLACTSELPTQPPAPPVINISPVININSQNATGPTSTTPSTNPSCNGAQVAVVELGWSVMGGTKPDGSAVARFAQVVPVGSVVQFDFTPKGPSGPIECHGPISYQTPAGPCEAVTLTESFNPRVKLTGPGICLLRATVDGKSATAEISGS